MTQNDYRLMHVANVLVIGTGLIYGWMKYCVKPESEFDLVGHAWQPHMQHLHILAAPLLVFLLGHFFYRHFLVFWKRGKKEGRRSGFLLALLILPMVISGYALQVSVNEGWRTLWIVTHIATSVVWVIAYLGHLWSHQMRDSGSRIVPATPSSP